MGKAGEAFEKLFEILAKLRAPGGCPWDREQTYKDINPYLLEEAHEIVESVDRRDFDGLKEELGDLLIHIFFYAGLAAEDKKFSAADVAQGAVEKLIRRHPHVFGDVKASTTKEVLENWEKIKQAEKKKGSMLEGLPKGMPALVKAFRLGEKTSRVGLDWSDRNGVLNKVKEELAELEAEPNEQEYGDLLFSLAQLGRFLKIDPETALRKACDRFTKRFQWIENKCRQKNQPLQNLTAAEWDALWEEAKQKNQKI
ncbi:MAG: nucleoside triphosphate pyrophosphohydrolase [Deltaproteobacteria bacterium]|nr:nucleoside triphosphate pyrophosphohydrolase [Deltaproteobacteria bacterium]MBI4224305.1 nucleoside triphosphate pyrophosphohydrolase [Deltaproteobacteria bacterium]